MDKLATRLGLRTNPPVFFTTAGLMVVFLALLLIFPTQIRTVFTDAREWIVTNLGWFFIIGVTAWLIFLVWLAISRYGKVRLGSDTDRPEYSNLSWFAMLFAGGIGTVLMFWGVAEPISHFANPPMEGVEPHSAQAAQDAMSISLYHLSLHTWAIFTVPGLVFGYFIYRYKLPMRVSSVFYPLLRERIYGPIGKAIDIFALLGTLFGLAVSIGLGSAQIQAGVVDQWNMPNEVWVQLAVIGIITAVALVSIVAGVDKGIKRLSNINIGAAFLLMLYVLIAGATVFLMRQLIESVGTYATDIFELAFWNDAMSPFTDEEGWGWQGGWTVFYWAWTVTWAPFMGVFLARISKGRTIREFVVGVLGAPSLFTLVWFVIFGWSAMNADGIGADARPGGENAGESAGALTETVVTDGDVPLAMFTFFQDYPGATFLAGLAIIMVALFLTTSVDSAALVCDILCNGTPEPAPVRQRVWWGVSLGALAVLLVWAGGDDGIEALRQVITVIGLPIFIMVCLMIPSMMVGLRQERLEPVSRRIARQDEEQAGPPGGPMGEECRKHAEEHPEDHPEVSSEPQGQG